MAPPVETEERVARPVVTTPAEEPAVVRARPQEDHTALPGPAASCTGVVVPG